MKKVQYVSRSSTSFGGFPKDCERSCKGSLIFLPNQQKLISDGEYDHIKEAYPHEVKYLRCQKLPSEEKVVLGKRKGKANSAKPRDAALAKQLDGNKLHQEAAKKKAAKDEVAPPKAGGELRDDKPVDEEELDSEE